MARRKKAESGPATVNMTPMIDVVFQLIIFFMLVNNIVSEESISMIVPKLYEPKVIELGEVNRIIINIVPPENPDSRFKGEGDPIKVRGDATQVKMGLRLYAYEELDDVSKQLEEARIKNPEIQVLLRADAATYYQNVQPVLAAITKAGIKVVNLVAYLPDEGPKNLNPK
jgi:biopolymer transport protein ExbD